MLYVSADTIYPIHEPPIKNGIIILNDDNVIEDVVNSDFISDKGKIKQYKGSICPGFINTHCHTELSHLHTQIPQHTGLVEFVQQVVKYRNQFSKKEILESIEIANDTMLKNGIVAVGDICNNADSIDIKIKSKIYYHNFIELIGFTPSSANDIFNKGKSLLNKFLDNNLIASFCAHAPYSVSSELMQLIALHEKNNLSCIHNQESKAENDFFITANGDFLYLFKNFGIDISHHHASGKSSLVSTIYNLEGISKIGLVHNTFISESDIDVIKNTVSSFYFCTCINANLFIENKLPDLNLLVKENQKICIGTDSLASNDELSILSELKTIQSNFNSFELNELLKWATLNGSEFLGIETQFGSLQKGKKPGLVVFDETEMTVQHVII